MPADLSSAPTSAVLRMLDYAWRDLYETPRHLYPLLHGSLVERVKQLQAELKRRARSGTISADELEFVGDEGSLEDALWRLQLQLIGLSFPERGSD